MFLFFFCRTSKLQLWTCDSRFLNSFFRKHVQKCKKPSHLLLYELQEASKQTKAYSMSTVETLEQAVNIKKGQNKVQISSISYIVFIFYFFFLQNCIYFRNTNNSKITWVTMKLFIVLIMLRIMERKTSMKTVCLI